MTTAGDAGGTGSLTGFYFREARFLSTARLEIDGQRLWLCEAASISPDQLQFVYTYPEVAVYRRSHRYYNPLSYHRGTVWAVEQATTIFGLRRFGFTARANDLARALFDLAALYPEQRIPECVGGYPRATHPAPGAYPQANAPQLWNATAFPLTVQTLAGIVPLAPYDTLIVDPALPDWLPELVFQNLRVGGATATLRFWRDARGRSKFQVLHNRGTLHVVRQPPPESLSADLWQRLHGVMESVA